MTPQQKLEDLLEDPGLSASQVQEIPQAQALQPKTTNVLKEARIAEELAAKRNIYNIHKVVMTTLSGAMGGLAVGYNLGVVAPAQLFLHDVYDDIDSMTVSVSLS